jgi:hypothetical protein
LILPQSPQLLIPADLSYLGSSANTVNLFSY